MSKFIQNIQKKCQKYNIYIPYEKLSQFCIKLMEARIPASKINKFVLLQNKKIMDYTGEITMKYIHNLSKPVFNTKYDILMKLLFQSQNIKPIKYKADKKNNKETLCKLFFDMVKTNYSINYTPSQIIFFFNQIYNSIPLKYEYKIPYMKAMIKIIMERYTLVDIKIFIYGISFLKGKIFTFDIEQFVQYCYATSFIASKQFSIDSVLKTSKKVIEKDIHKLKKQYVGKLMTYNYILHETYYFILFSQQYNNINFSCYQPFKKIIMMKYKLYNAETKRQIQMKRISHYRNYLFYYKYHYNSNFKKIIQSFEYITPMHKILIMS